MECGCRTGRFTLRALSVQCHEKFFNGFAEIVKDDPRIPYEGAF